MTGMIYWTAIREEPRMCQGFKNSSPAVINAAEARGREIYKPVIYQSSFTLSEEPF